MVKEDFGLLRERRIKMKIIFDVGACDGMDGISLCKTDDCILYSFEAEPKWIETIKTNFNNNPNFNLISKAVSDKNGTAEFNFCKAGGASSLYTFKDEETLNVSWSGRTDIHYSGKSIVVETIRLDTFIEQNNIKQIDYLHIDTQGHDLCVLQSLGKYIDIVLEGDCEVARTKESAIYIDQSAVYDDVVLWLEQNNFIIQDTKPNDYPNNNEWVIKFKRNT
jgi:FkbM family methyltransferase